MRTERSKPGAMDLQPKNASGCASFNLIEVCTYKQPLITPLPLVEVSVKRGRMPASGPLSRQSASRINSSRQNHNNNQDKDKKQLLGS